jgi:hypothetical protein
MKKWKWISTFVMELGYSTQVRNSPAYKNKWPVPYMESFKIYMITMD